MAKTTEQISVFLENRPGQLSKALKILSGQGIDIYALNISETEKYGIMRIVVNDTPTTMNILQKHGFLASLAEIFIIPIENVPGALSSLIDKITACDINIDYMYSMVVFGEGDSAYMAIAVTEVDKMQACLDKNGIETFEGYND